MTDPTPAFARYRALIDDWSAFIEACRSPLPTCLWLRPDDGRDVAAAVREDGIEGRMLDWIAGGLRLDRDPDLYASLSYRAGLFHVMEEVSMLPVELLGPRPGERILDLCSAPGNKTALIAARMRGTGTVVANDASSGRQAITRTTLHRMGLVNVTLSAADGTDSAWSGLDFDRVLVDAPCSCEGTVRKHPRAATRTTESMREKLVRNQRALLRSAVQACRPGGRIVYATCTFAPEENEGVVADILGAFGDEVRVLPVDVPGLRVEPGITRWNGERYPDALRDTIRIWPHRGDTGGFFCAVLERAGRPSATPSPRLPEPGVPSGHPSIRRYVTPVLERFGVAPADAERLRFRLDGHRHVSIVNRDHAPGIPFGPLSVGLSAIRIRSAVARPTTQGAIALGTCITRSTVDLDRSAALDFVARHPVPVERLSAGHHVVRWRRFPLGMALARPLGHRSELESLHPRTWAGLQPRNNH